MHLYIHVPFCSRRCSYCDFAIAVRRSLPVADYVSAVERELSIRALGGERLATVYLGGGTPSKLGGDGVRALLDVVRARFELVVDAEVTLEANPEDVTREVAAAWRRAGVNRLSIGAQSFDPAVLEWMHRTHTSEGIARAVRAARDAGFANLSLDLIFALPDSLSRDWDADLDRALSLAPEHVSVYGLTVEHATPLGRWTARGDVDVASDDRWADEFLRANERLSAAGYPQYEVSNYARPSFRAVHNAAYWRGVPYLGVGPSAHGYDGATRRWNSRDYVAWRDTLESGADPVAGAEQLTDQERAAERVYLGLRSDLGLQLEPGDETVVDSWMAAGWAAVIERHGSRFIVLTPSGWLRLDALAAALTVFRSR